MEETKNPEKKMDMTSTDPENYKKLLKDTKISESDNFLQKSEYRDKYDGNRLYNRQGPSKVYVSKRAGDESDFWGQGKFCYDEYIYRIIENLIAKKKYLLSLKVKKIIEQLQEFLNILMLYIMEEYLKILNFYLVKDLIIQGYSLK